MLSLIQEHNKLDKNGDQMLSPIIRQKQKHSVMSKLEHPVIRTNYHFAHYLIKCGSGRGGGESFGLVFKFKSQFITTFTHWANLKSAIKLAHSIGLKLCLSVSLTICAQLFGCMLYAVCQKENGTKAGYKMLEKFTIGQTDVGHI